MYMCIWTVNWNTESDTLSVGYLPLSTLAPNCMQYHVTTKLINRSAALPREAARNRNIDNTRQLQPNLMRVFVVSPRLTFVVQRQS
jgi:hypothetical protein